jgi:hypothetical protein
MIQVRVEAAVAKADDRLPLPAFWNRQRLLEPQFYCTALFLSFHCRDVPPRLRKMNPPRIERIEGIPTISLCTTNRVSVLHVFLFLCAFYAFYTR